MLCAVSALLYLGQSPSIVAKRQTLESQHWPGVTLLKAVGEAYREGRRCVEGLPKTIVSGTNPVTEALQLSASNAVIFADSGGDGARRSYGCLYGFEIVGSAASPPIASPWVAWVGRVQRALSVTLLFLFGLGLRNALKMK
jgi:hypothetical protein